MTGADRNSRSSAPQSGTPVSALLAGLAVGICSLFVLAVVAFVSSSELMVGSSAGPDYVRFVPRESASLLLVLCFALSVVSSTFVAASSRPDGWRLAIGLGAAVWMLVCYVLIQALSEVSAPTPLAVISPGVLILALCLLGARMGARYAERNSV